MKPYFERDGITIFHGDCREILPALAAETFDSVITDPPYLVSYSGRWDSDQECIHGDSDPSWVEPVFEQLFRVLKNDSLCLTFYGWPHAEIFHSAWRKTGFRTVSSIVLLKKRWGLGYFTRGQHEHAYLLAKGKPRKPHTVISDVVEGEQTFPQCHPNQKPLDAISKLLGSYSSISSLVLDPFCGSGTTLVAARNLGRRAVGIEIEERYCELVALRLAQEPLDFVEVEPEFSQLPLLDTHQGE